MSFGGREDINIRNDANIMDGPDRLGTYTRSLRKNERPSAGGYDDYSRGGNNDFSSNNQTMYSEYDTNPLFAPRQAYIPSSTQSPQLNIGDPRGSSIDPRLNSRQGNPVCTCGAKCHSEQPPQQTQQTQQQHQLHSNQFGGQRPNGGCNCGSESCRSKRF